MWLLLLCWQFHKAGHLCRPWHLTCRSPIVNWTPTTASTVSRPMRLRGSIIAPQAPVRRSHSVAVSATKIASCLSRYVTASAYCVPSVHRMDHQRRLYATTHGVPSRLGWWPPGLLSLRRRRTGLCWRQRRIERRRRRHCRPPASSSTVQAKTAVSVALRQTPSAARSASAPIPARLVFPVVIRYFSSDLTRWDTQQARCTPAKIPGSVNPVKGRNVNCQLCHPGLTYILNFWNSGTLALCTPEY